jgi:hypothetical protein
MSDYLADGEEKTREEKRREGREIYKLIYLNFFSMTFFSDASALSGLNCSLFILRILKAASKRGHCSAAELVR